MSTQYKRLKMLSIAGIGGLLALPLVSTTAYAQTESTADNNEVRVTASRQIVRGGRDGVSTGTVRHEFAALQTTGPRQNSTAQKLGSASSETRALAVSDDFWFYDADVILFNDFDNDGYFHGIDLLFDVDTFFDAADVYAVVYLSLDGGPWNEYSATDD
ncbi:MAG: choice-of-anchor H family protein, partial [Woeseia sp.]